MGRNRGGFLPGVTRLRDNRVRRDSRESAQGGEVASSDHPRKGHGIQRSGSKLFERVKRS